MLADNTHSLATAEAETISLLSQYHPFIQEFFAEKNHPSEIDLSHLFERAWPASGHSKLLERLKGSISRDVAQQLVAGAMLTDSESYDEGPFSGVFCRLPCYKIGVLPEMASDWCDQGGWAKQIVEELYTALAEAFCLSGECEEDAASQGIKYHSCANLVWASIEWSWYHNETDQTYRYDRLFYWMCCCSYSATPPTVDPPTGIDVLETEAS